MNNIIKLKKGIHIPLDPFYFIKVNFYKNGKGVREWEFPFYAAVKLFFFNSLLINNSLLLK